MSSVAAEETPGTDLDKELEEVLDEFGDSPEADTVETSCEEPASLEVAKPLPQESERAAVSLRVLPMHLAATKRTRGRPRRVENVPSPNDLTYHAQISEAKSRFVDEDRVVAAARNRSEAAHMLHLIKEQIACEAAAIHFQRMENEKLGKDTAQTSTRRIDALTKIAGIELEIKKLGADLIDLRGERFQRVFKLWIETIRQVAAETLPPELIDLFFNRLSTEMDGWEDKAMDNVR